MQNQYLALPGPTQMCPEALQAMSGQMFNHRGPKFIALYNKVIENCRELFQTKNDLFILTASGTGAMEAAVVNTISPGDSILAIVNGAFGARFADIASSYGASVDRFQGKWGQGIDLAALEQAMQAKRFKAILIVHCETSTGVLNQLEEVSLLRKKYQAEALLLVDAVSSLGAARLMPDQWDLDVVVTGSQKVLAAAPGLSLLSFSPRAWKAYEQSTAPKYYWDINKYKDFIEKGQTPWTPAVSLFLALEQASQRFIDEKLDNAIERHQRVKLMIRAGVRALGLELFCPDEFAAPTVTSIFMPKLTDVHTFRALLRDRYGFIVAGGQGNLADSIFRIGHLGIIDEQIAVSYLDCLERGLLDIGMEFTPGTSIQAALKTLRKEK